MCVYISIYIHTYTPVSEELVDHRSPAHCSVWALVWYHWRREDLGLHISFASCWELNLHPDYAQNLCSEAPSGQCTASVLSTLSLLCFNLSCVWMKSVKKVSEYGSVVHVVIKDQLTKHYLWVVSSLFLSLYWNIPKCLGNVSYYIGAIMKWGHSDFLRDSKHTVFCQV